MKSISVGENLHSQQVETFASGVEIVWFFGGILHGVSCGDMAFKHQFPVFFGNSHAVIRDFQFGAFFSFPDGYGDPAFIGGVFDGVSQ